MILTTLKAPFPWFGGKSRVAETVWDRFGNVSNYVEPFFGSGAVLLGRPSAPGIETVNDKDCYLANFWRALRSDPEGLASLEDWPVNEADLHARHLWLVNREGFRERMKTEPEYFDLRVAAWWGWGIAQWIGRGWCALKGCGRGVNRFPEGWECVAWKAAAGYGSQADGAGRANCHRERIWFSPHCLRLPSLF